MSRRSLLALRPALVLAFLALSPGAAALLGYPDPPPDGAYCPTYDIDTGEVEGTRVQASSLLLRPWGATVVQVGDYYLVEDTAYVNSVGEPYLFSIWIYEETNQMPGLQRGDEACHDAPPGIRADTIVN